ncbi:MAG: hypothetical protein HZB25_03710 [Candidatus Eisenbacteria bacterium]|nr:hypothetical protein [Candidatus Eisenbacteria bacterium]
MRRAEAFRRPTRAAAVRPRGATRPGRPAWATLAVLWIALACLASGAFAQGAPPPVPGAPITSNPEAVDSLHAAAGDSALVDSAAADTGNPFVAAPRDTSGAPFHYTSSYSVNRNLATWNQILNVDTRYRDLKIDNSTTINFREDTERKQRTGSRNQNLSLTYGKPRGLRVGFALDLQRDNDGPIVNGRLKPTSSFNTTSARLTLSDSVYLSDVNFLRLGLEGGRVSREESGGVRRTGSGNDLAQKFEWTYVPRGPLKLQLLGSNTNVVTDAEGVQQGVGVGGQDTTLVANTRNRNKDFNLNGKARLAVPWHALSAELSATHGDTRQQQPTLGRQETLTQKVDNLNGKVTAQLVPKLILNVEATANKNLVLSDVDSSRNYDTRSRGGNVALNYADPMRLGSLSLVLGDRLSTNDFRKRNSGSLQDVTEHTLAVTYQRAFMQQRFQLQLNLSAQLNGTRYDVPTQNQDYLNRRIGGSLTYSPEFPITLGFQASEVMSHYVFLHSSQSNKNAIDRLYSIEYDIMFRPRAGLSLSQSYIVSADANISDFESYPGILADNRYTKTTSYVTRLLTNLTKKVDIEMNNNLRLTRSGSYDLDPGLGIRLLGESSRGQNNDLLLKVNYRLVRTVSAQVQTRAQFIHQNGLDGLGNPVPSSRQRIMELNLGMNVAYPFSERARINGTFSRSSRADRYTPYSLGKPGTPRDNNRDYFLITATFDLVIR